MEHIHNIWPSSILGQESSPPSWFREQNVKMFQFCLQSFPSNSEPTSIPHESSQPCHRHATHAQVPETVICVCPLCVSIIMCWSLQHYTHMELNWTWVFSNSATKEEDKTRLNTLLPLVTIKHFCSANNTLFSTLFQFIFCIVSAQMLPWFLHLVCKKK